MTSDVVAEAQARRAQLQAWRRELRYKRVLGFLVAKGFMTAPDIQSMPSVKIPLVDALWVGENVEPRILEVLPAAILRFPRSFLLGGALPADLEETLADLRRGNMTGQPFRGVPYERIARWAAHPLPDRRSRPIHDRRVARTFRLRPDLLSQLARHASQTNRTQTAVIETALGALLSKGG